MLLKAEEARTLIRANPVIILTTINANGRPNAATFAWVSSTSFKPPLLTIAISPKRYTWQNLKKNGEFVVNIPTRKNLEQLWYVGTRSGRDEKDKIAKAGFTTRPSNHVKPPKLNECVAWIECQVKDLVREGDHDLVVGHVLSGEVVDDLWNGERFLTEKAQLIWHLGGRLFLTGQEIVKI